MPRHPHVAELASLATAGSTRAAISLLEADVSTKWICGAGGRIRWLAVRRRAGQPSGDLASILELTLRFGARNRLLTLPAELDMQQDLLDEQSRTTRSL